MVTIRNLQLSMVVVLGGGACPRSLDSRKRGAAVSSGVDIRHWLRRPRLAVEDTRVAVVEEHGVEGGAVRPLAQPVASLRSDMAEDVGADVPAPERV